MAHTELHLNNKSQNDECQAADVPALQSNSCEVQLGPADEG